MIYSKPYVYSVGTWVAATPYKMIGDRDLKLIGGQVSAALEGINEDK